jgi:hypothetical protein
MGADGEESGDDNHFTLRPHTPSVALSLNVTSPARFSSQVERTTHLSKVRISRRHDRHISGTCLMPRILLPASVYHRIHHNPVATGPARSRAVRHRKPFGAPRSHRLRWHEVAYARWDAPENHGVPGSNPGLATSHSGLYIAKSRKTKRGQNKLPAPSTPITIPTRYGC